MSNHIAVALDQAGLAWFNTLKNRFLALLPSLTAPTPQQSVAIAEIKRILDIQTSQLLQQHLADLEDWLLVLLSGSDLKQWVNSLRDDYRDIFGAEALQRILPTLLPQVSAAADADLLAEARRLQSELHWHYSLQPWALQKRQEMMTGILTTLTIILIVVAIIWGLSNVWNLSRKGLFGAVLALLGTLGGSISSIQRVQSTDFTNSRAVSVARQDRFALSVILSPLQGAFFALLFTLLLAAGVVMPGFVVPNVSLQSSECPCPTNLAAAAMSPASSSTITSAPIPKVSLTLATNDTKTTNQNLQSPATQKANAGKKEETNGVVRTANNDKPDPAPPKGEKEEPGKGKSPATENNCRFPFFNMQLCFGSGKDIALLLIWAFIAGFSERLVPDMLTRMADKGR